MSLFSAMCFGMAVGRRMAGRRRVIPAALQFLFPCFDEFLSVADLGSGLAAHRRRCVEERGSSRDRRALRDGSVLTTITGCGWSSSLPVGRPAVTAPPVPLDRLGVARARQSSWPHGRLRRCLEALGTVRFSSCYPRQPELEGVLPCCRRCQPLRAGDPAAGACAETSEAGKGALVPAPCVEETRIGRGANAGELEAGATERPAPAW
jgi:hypothetical protein